jgi:hypothetical protein
MMGITEEVDMSGQRSDMACCGRFLKYMLWHISDSNRHVKADLYS